jgi:hypothetical protein
VKNVFDIAEARGRRRTELESMRRQLLATQRSAGHYAEQARLAIEHGDMPRALRLLRMLETSGELAARLLAEQG